MNSVMRPGFRIKKPEPKVKIPEWIYKSTAFVVSIASEGNDSEEYDFQGTGFLVGRPIESLPGRSHFYFVTTAHTLKRAVIAGEDTPSAAIRYGVRVNLRQGGTAVVPIARWFTHPNDRNADVAIAPFENLYHDYEIQFLSEQVFRDLRTPRVEIGLGDEVYFPGLFTLTQQESDKRNLPILRMGNIAMLPDNKVPTEAGMMDAYLIEARSIGGLSGSPVFSRRTMSLLWNDDTKGEAPRAIHGMTGEIHLIGMMHGHWDVKEGDINQVTINIIDKHRSVNMGISVVIPIHKIAETIEHPTLELMRKEWSKTFSKGLRLLPMP